VWQLNVKVPDDSPSGDAIPIHAVINTTPSNTVTVAIK